MIIKVLMNFCNIEIRNIVNYFILMNWLMKLFVLILLGFFAVLIIVILKIVNLKIRNFINESFIYQDFYKIYNP